MGKKRFTEDASETAAPAVLTYVQITTGVLTHPCRPDRSCSEEKTAELGNANVWVMVALFPKP